MGEADEHIHARVRVLLTQGPFEGSAKVVVVGLEPRGERVVGEEPLLGFDRQPTEEGEMGVPYGTRLRAVVAGRQTTAGELADRLQQTVSGHGAVVGGDHQRLVHETRQQVEDLQHLDPRSGAHRLGGVEREPASEDRQAVQQDPLCLTE